MPVKKWSKNSYCESHCHFLGTKIILFSIFCKILAVNELNSYLINHRVSALPSTERRVQREKKIEKLVFVEPNGGFACLPTGFLP